MIRVVLISVFIFGSVYSMEKPTGRPIFAPASIITPEQEAEIAKLPEKERNYKLRDFIVHNILEGSLTLDDAIQRIKELAKESAYKVILAFDYDYIKKYGPVEWLAHQDIDSIMKYYVKAFNRPTREFVDVFHKAIPALAQIKEKIYPSNFYEADRMKVSQLVDIIKQLATDPNTAPYINNYRLLKHIIDLYFPSSSWNWDIQFVALVRTPGAAEFIKKYVIWENLFSEMYEYKKYEKSQLLFLVQNLPTITTDLEQEKASILMLWAIYNQGSEIVKALLQKRFNPNFQFTQETLATTALMNAVWKRETEIVRLLLEAGADPNMKSKYIPSIHAERYDPLRTDLPLILAIREDLPEIVELLLTNFAVEVRKLREEHASSYLRLLPADIVKIAAHIAKPTPPADPNLLDSYGNLALNVAIQRDLPQSQPNQRIIQLLLNAGAQINAKDERGETPLMIAAKVGKLDLVKFLLEKGADPTLRNNKGKSVYSFASESEGPDKQAILKYLDTILEEHGSY